MLTYSRLGSSALSIMTIIGLPVIATAQLDQQVQINSDSTIIFGGFIIAVIALGVYIARDAILRKKTDYDSAEYASKKDRSHDQYKSSWQDDYVEPVLQAKPISDHYETLGIKNTATDAEIKLRYRELVKKHHPDKTGGDSKDLVRINKAYEALSNAASRRKYDKSLSF